MSTCECTDLFLARNLSRLFPFAPGLLSNFSTIPSLLSFRFCFHHISPCSVNVILFLFILFAFPSALSCRLLFPNQPQSLLYQFFILLTLFFYISTIQATSTDISTTFLKPIFSNKLGESVLQHGLVLCVYVNHFVILDDMAGAVVMVQLSEAANSYAEPRHPCIPRTSRNTTMQISSSSVSRKLRITHILVYIHTFFHHQHRSGNSSWYIRGEPVRVGHPSDVSCDWTDGPL